MTHHRSTATWNTVRISVQRAWIIPLLLALFGSPLAAQAAFVGGATSIYSGNNSTRPGGVSDDWEDAENLSLSTYGTLTFDYTDSGTDDYTTINYAHASYSIEFLEVSVDDSTPSTLWFGALPVSAGATWSSSGRLTSEFATAPNTATFLNTGSNTIINYHVPSLSLDDPHLLGLNQSWFLLFKITTGEAVNELYGWLELQSMVPSSGAYQGSYVQFTNWGINLAGNELPAGQAGAPSPWTMMGATLFMLLLSRMRTPGGVDSRSTVSAIPRD